MIRHSHMKTLDDSVAWKKAGGRRREDNTQEKWWWWWWWRRQWWWRWRWRGWMAMEMMMNDSWRESNVIYPRFHAFFVPTEGLPQGWHLSDSQNQKACCFCTAKNLRRFHFTHRSLCTERDLHRAAFTQTLLHTDAFTYRSFYFLHRKAFSKEALPHEAFTQSSFTHRRSFTKKFLHTGTLMRRCPSFYTQELFQTHTRTRLTKRSF